MHGRKYRQIARTAKRTPKTEGGIPKTAVAGPGWCGTKFVEVEANTGRDRTRIKSGANQRRIALSVQSLIFGEIASVAGLASRRKEKRKGAAHKCV
jgi:hypothetical protein